MRENFNQLTMRDKTWRKYDKSVILKYISIVGGTKGRQWRNRKVGISPKIMYCIGFLYSWVLKRLNSLLAKNNINLYWILKKTNDWNDSCLQYTDVYVAVKFLFQLIFVIPLFQTYQHTLSYLKRMEHIFVLKGILFCEI